jgi:hypothetical protein
MTTATKAANARNTKAEQSDDLGTRILARHKQRVADISEEQLFYRATLLKKANGEPLDEQTEEALEICAGVLSHDLRADFEKLSHIAKLSQRWLGGLPPHSAELRVIVSELYAEVQAKKNEAAELEEKARQLRNEATHLGNKANTTEAAEAEIVRLKDELRHIFPQA